MYMRSNKGFTLMELMIVIAIMMILAGAVVARISVSTEKAKIAKAKSDLDQIAAGCRAFNMDTDAWPYSNVGILGPKANVVAKTGAGVEVAGATLTTLRDTNWKGPYIEADVWPKDPWETDYKWNADANKVTISSWGPDKDAGAADNIVVVVHRFI